MAKKKNEVIVERTYIIPLRKEFQKAPKNKRAKKAIIAIKEFLKRHMKTENVSIGPHLNKLVWKNGIQNPPHHVKVDVLRDGDLVRTELTGFKIELPTKKEAKKTDAPTLKDKVDKLIKDKKPDKSKEEAVEEKEDKKETKTDKKKVSEEKSAKKEEDSTESTDKKKGKTEQEKILTKKDSSVNY